MAMNFRTRDKEPPEINLIPFIDVLLVILIFLILSTTYNKFTELQVNLPLADAQAQQERPKEVLVGIDRAGNYSVNRVRFARTDATSLATALQAATKEDGAEAIVVIHADASARHQAVITVMEAARRVGLTHISFSAQTPGSAQSR